MLLLVVEISVALLAIIVVWFKWKYQYWARRNVPFIPPTIPLGNGPNPFSKKTKQFGVAFKDLYDNLKKRNLKDIGMYALARPSFFTRDLDLIKNIFAKDFQYFTDRDIPINEKVDPLSGHLVNVGGTKWRKLRTKLTPTFTSGKLKSMFQILVDCEQFLHEFMEKEYQKHAPIDVKEALSRFTTDIIGSCAFGLDCDSIKNDNSPFRIYGKRVFQPSIRRAINRIVFGVSAELAGFFGFTRTPKDITEFFIKIVGDTIKYREDNKVTRNDFLQLLINLKNSKNEDDRMTLEEIAAQCFVFFLAGFETSSTTMTFVLYNLAKHEDIQEKLRQEITSVLNKHEGKITYEALQEMVYMNQVIDETLRLYPPVPALIRRCVKDYKVPDRDFIIEKGTQIIIPVLGIHHDEDYYPDPEKFDPERFTEEGKASRHNYTHLPFGEGPRNCIGLRFGLMETKVGLTSMIKNYRFKVSKKTQEPLKMQANTLILAAVGEIWLDAEKV